MKKHLLLITAVLCAVYITNAQQSYKVTSPLLGNEQRVVRSLLSRNAAATNLATAKTTAIKERVIGSSNYGMGNILFDSSRYVYTNNRGSSFNYSLFMYTPFDPYNNGGAPLFMVPLYTNALTSPQVFADTCVDYQNTGTIMPYRIIDCTYDSYNNLTGYYMVQGTSYSKNVISYNAQNQPVSSTVLLGSGLAGPWDTSLVTQYSYNANLLASDSSTQYISSSWVVPYYKDVYECDMASNITAIHTYAYDNNNNEAPYEATRYVNTYDLANRLIKVAVSQTYSAANALTPYLTDTFAYTPGSGFFTYYRITDSVGDSVNNLRYIIGANHLPDTVYTGYPDSALGWVNIMQVVTYDTANNPVECDQYPLVPGFPSSQPSNVIRYYYQSYNDVDVPSIAAEGDCKVYPNPATSELNIIVPPTAQYSRYTVQLVNAQGQVIMQQLSSDTQTKLSLVHLAAGMYWLQVTDNSGGTYRRSIVKE